jgi:phosphoribosylformylglycinamidine synthase
MILFFRTPAQLIYAVGHAQPFSKDHIQKLTWLFGYAELLKVQDLPGPFIGPRREMITPWATNAVEITQTMGIKGITRIEEFHPASSGSGFDRMLQHRYDTLDQELFTIHHTPDPIIPIDNIADYSQKEGLALSNEEVGYLEEVSKKLGRKLTDSEVFGFSQVNSEHCRHKIFNGTFVIDGVEKTDTLFQLIKKTSKEHPNFLVSAYKDNVAFIEGPTIEQFAPERQDIADYFKIKDINSVISLKAETHNFPTTVEPFNGAATGAGGEIRDRLAGGKGSLPLAGTAVYITSYPRLDKGRPWEKKFSEREWLYQTPAEILIKASDGASDFGNKFGQPLICGSVLTFEHFEHGRKYGFDKVIMLAGGMGYGKKEDSQKEHLQPGDQIVLMGGDNYRIGMGGGAVSSVATGEFASGIELNAVQRSNPEMQKRVMNAIRAMAEMDNNPIVSIHDHGAGGHLNCFSELLEETGGTIHIDQLPIGDPTLSDKEIISNESQERMGLAIRSKDLNTLEAAAKRERAPLYVAGIATGDKKLTFTDQKKNTTPLALEVNHLFGSSPKTVLNDRTPSTKPAAVKYEAADFNYYLGMVLQLEAVACKDWLTNKVDRSVTGRVAMQQTCGPIQLPLNNVAVMALDFNTNKGVATSVGHAPAAALIDAAKGSRLAISEALLNIIWTPLTHGLKGVSLSANWMWPAKNEGENARLYAAVESVSKFCIDLGINVPTGKDSLSMTQKYPGGDVVYSPGTVIISAFAECADIRKSVSPAIIPGIDSKLVLVNLSEGGYKLGGSSLAQVLNLLGDDVPGVVDAHSFAKTFAAIQTLISGGYVLAGHDVSSGGLIITLLEMCFPVPGIGMKITISENDLVKALFSENPAIVLQVGNLREVEKVLKSAGAKYEVIGEVVEGRKLTIEATLVDLKIDQLRERWFHTSYLLDKLQRTKGHADKRRDNIFNQALEYRFQPKFDGKFSTYGIDPHRRTPSGLKAAIIRDKGVNGDREMAYSLYVAGFDVKDVHMTDLMSGKEDLSDLNLIVFVGGFSNSDVLGSAKGWAGAFLYNPKAKAALDNFYNRKDTLSLGVCNGCQLMMELGLVNRNIKMKDHPKMRYNGSGRFESIFVNLSIPDNNSVMLSTMAGSRLAAWVAHGEGMFALDRPDQFNVSAVYSYKAYPGNPNESFNAIAALHSDDGRHLAIMPHIERSLFPWNWGHYPYHRRSDEVGPWIEAFVNAREWVKGVVR